jgi:hypothetical protein
MIELTSKKMEYVEIIANKFPYTLFVWAFMKPNDSILSWTNPKIYGDINLQVFWRKRNMCRGALWDSETDEMRIDLDYKCMDDNIKVLTEIVTKFRKFGITKYLMYVSGGKGLHIHFRYKFVFGDEDRADIRKSIYECLNFAGDIDTSLFRTNQPFGLEGFNHRTTDKTKELITLEDGVIVYSRKSLEFDYLTSNYVNDLSKEFIDLIYNNLKPIKINSPIIHNPNNTPPVFYNSTSFDWHIKRFYEMYSNLNDGRRRTLDMFIRYVYLTTKNEEVTRYYYKIFCDSINIKVSNDTIIKKVSATLNSMKSNAIFIYKDVFTKEDFYKTYIKEVDR